MARSGWAYVDFSYLNQVGGPTGSLQFLTGPNELSGSHLLVFDTGSNNVGIGLTNFDGLGAGIPTHKLHVYGDVSVTGSIYADNYIIKNVSQFDSSGSSNFGDSSDDLHEFTGSVSVSQKLAVGTSPTYILDISASSAEAFRVQGSTNGQDVNCLIENKGTSSGDDTLLGLYAEPNAGDPSLRFAIAGTETWSMGIDNSDSDKFKISQASTLHTDTRLTIKPMGNVGIGTPDPTDLLTVSGVTYGSSAGIHIAADLNDDAYLDLTEHNGSDVTAFGATDTFGFRIAYDGASGVEALQFKTGNEATVYTRMSIKRDTGFVLIGGGAATGLLHVNGAAATGAPTLIVDHDDDDQKGAVFNIASKYDVGIDINLSNLDANGIDISADDVTTASAMHISADSLTTGNVLKISGTDGKTDLKIVSSADSGDYFSIATTTAGATTITTVDDDAQAADLTFAIDGDFIVDADGGDISFKDGGTTALILDLDTTAGACYFQNGAGNAVIAVDDGDRRLYFYDKGGEHIAGDGSHLSLTSGGRIDLTAASDVVIPSGIGLHFDGTTGAEKIESDGTNLTITSGAKVILQAAANSFVEPATDNNVSLGSASKRWSNVYTGDLHLKNERGDWTIVEEAEYLTLTNNINGKRYKIMMQEIED